MKRVKDTTVPVTVQLTIQQTIWLDALSEKYKESKSSIVRRLLHEAQKQNESRKR